MSVSSRLPLIGSLLALTVAPGCKSHEVRAPARAGGPCPAGMALVPEKPAAAGGVPMVAFCLDRTEVTVAGYAECIGQAACVAFGEGRGCNKDKLETENHPVNCVGYPEAAAYCKAQGKRLPVEAEWAWAAAGAGSSAPPLSDRCSSQATTCPVDRDDAGETPQGVKGLYGNVSEWTDTRGAAAGSREVEGASYAEGPEEARSRAGVALPEGTRSPQVGFRCAR